MHDDLLLIIILRKGKEKKELISTYSFVSYSIKRLHPWKSE